ncbi:hypothetical protein HCAG_05067 [Histoplasma mississippiense (nom. inval.)]|uniref:hypothetical protein n=1 Tax=Ajellomyces capsulatus (strain NAm1 / WU24) TaxID=2059318 RepID=UPI000157C5BA|nr:hypothetical protein HCAG_05067 [Histoplasma mississippiense (nom. inval.)]EDN08568.1 hypothetical protein HCAG_05067 [Histoplasma mississippiense (nom. inval.)]
MPSLAPLPQRRQRADAPESDSNSPISDRPSRISRDGTPFSQVSNGSKRIRLAAPNDHENDQSDANGTSEDDSDDISSGANGMATSTNTLRPPSVKTVRGSRAKRSAGGRQESSHGNGPNPEHRPGSIVRVKLRDFVTYTSAEFFPGPRLNMVIGPNGTGKSTLHLGRAKDPAEFVKHGCEEATIEIELAKGRNHRENPVIRRTIVRKGNKSTFTINGKPSSKASVLELAKSFSIQIDNLCQFLPQDKVAEFAALSPIELLHSTQRAAAGPQMLQWHEDLKSLRAEQKKLLAANAGEREQLANLELQTVLTQKRELAAAQEGLVADGALKLEKAQEDIKDLDVQIEAEKKGALAHRDNLKRSLQIINKLTRQMEEEPVEYDAAAYTEKIRESVRHIRAIEEEMRNVHDAKNKASMDCDLATQKIARENERLENLNSESGRQEEKLKNLSADTAKAWAWIKANRTEFQSTVFGPPLLQAPITDEELHSLGFDCWAKDLLSGPEPVVAMLCSENRLNRTPIARRDITDDEYTRMTNSPISSWVTGRQSYQVTRRREYGPSAISTRVRQLKPAQFWTNQPADLSARSIIENKIKELQKEVDTFQGVFDEHKDALATLRRRHQDAQERKRDLESEKAAKQTALTNYKALPTKKSQQEDKLRASEAAIVGVRRRVEALRDKQDQLSLEKASRALEYANYVDEFQHLIEDLALAEVNLLEAVSDLDALQERNSEVNQMLESKKAEVEDAIKECSKLKERVDKCRHDFKEFADYVSADPDMQTGEIRELVETIKSYTVDQLEADIDSERAALELAGEGNSNVIKEFELRQERIDKLKEHLTEFRQNLNELDEAIAEVRGQWEPRLENLVKRISDAFADSFSRIGCAGQVSIDKAEDVTPEHENFALSATQTDNGNRGTNRTNDFDQWSIRIQVRFRENENFSILDAHRQSGGERAVSTIFYLMALQSLSASPFRVVDEINQGMDPRNERMVHERMVDIACASGETGGDGGGQYFLITPKLLSGLKYKRGMKVLCIVSGEYVPENYQQMDFGKCVLRMKDVLKARGKGKGAEIGGGVEGIDIGA